MREAVSNSSPLINLAAVGHLALLQRQFEQVVIPPAVYREVVEHGQTRPGAPEVATAVAKGWMQIVTPRETAVAEILRTQLDAGEAEAIALAVERHPVAVLLDERNARSIAERMLLPVIGTLGVLLRGKQCGDVAAIGSLLETLQRDMGFRISPELHTQVLRAAGEACSDVRDQSMGSDDPHQDSNG